MSTRRPLSQDDEGRAGHPPAGRRRTPKLLNHTDEIRDRIGRPLWAVDGRACGLNADVTLFIRKYGTMLRDVMARRHPGVEVAFALYEADEMNALCRVLGGNGERFVIAISREAFAEVHAFLADGETAVVLSASAPTLWWRGRAETRREVLLLAMALLLFHELAHVTRGHLGYLGACRLNADVSELEPETGDAEADRIYYQLECHADTHAGYLLSASVAELSRNCASVSDGAPMEAVSLAGFAIMTVARLLEHERRGPSPRYPAYDVRLGMFATQIVRGFGRFALPDPTGALCLGMEAAHRLCALSGKERVIEGEDRGLAGFMRRDAPNIDALTIALRPFALGADGPSESLF